MFNQVVAAAALSVFGYLAPAVHTYRAQEHGNHHDQHGNPKTTIRMHGIDRIR